MNAPRAAASSARVVHATECAAAGTLTVIVALAHELASAGAVQLLLYSRRPETPEDLISRFPAGMQFVEVPAAKGLHVAFVRHFAGALRRITMTWQPDVVHLHSSKAGFVGRFSLPRRSGARVLYSPHGLAYLDPDRSLRNAVFKSLEYLAAKTGAMQVACSRSEGKLLSALSGRPATVLENPVEHQFFCVTQELTAPPAVVSVGRLSRQKSPQLFAAVALRVRELRPGTRFIWVGDGDAHFKSILTDAGCELMGWRSQQEVATYLSAATVYLQTSLWEGLPVSVIQALAAGVPCVVHDCAGNRDAVTHERTGFIGASIEELTLQVTRLLDSPALRQAMSSDARSDAVRRFGSAVFSKHVRQLYSVEAKECLLPPASSEQVATG